MSQDQLNQLPCITFISCGDCPFRERCCFLHDPRIKSFKYKSSIRKKNLMSNYTDNIFYWPKIDKQNRNSSKYLYDIKLNDPKYDYMVIYSIWCNFVDNINSYQKKNNLDTYYEENNRYTHRNRLPIFIELSNKA